MAPEQEAPARPGLGEGGDKAKPQNAQRLVRALPVAGLLVAAWAVLPPYTGPSLATATRVEVADHVVPAVVVLALSLAALTQGRRPQPGTLPLLSGLGVLLAGFWMTATHLPLVVEAMRNEVGPLAAAYHTLPGLAVTILGTVWAWVHWSDAAE